MTNGHNHTASMRMSAWVNDINPVNWKTVLVGYMQLAFLAVVMVVWAVYVLTHPDKGMQETVLSIVAGLLAGLSGITLVGRINDRKTDYGYIERMNARPADPVQPQVVTTGDNTHITATLPVAPATPIQRKASDVSDGDDDPGLA